MYKVFSSSFFPRKNNPMCHIFFSLSSTQVHARKINGRDRLYCPTGPYLSELVPVEREVREIPVRFPTKEGKVCAHVRLAQISTLLLGVYISLVSRLHLFSFATPRNITGNSPTCSILCDGPSRDL